MARKHKRELKLTIEEQNLYNILVIDLEEALGALQTAEQELSLSEQQVKQAEEDLRLAVENWKEKKKVVTGVEAAYEWFIRDYIEE